MRSEHRFLIYSGTFGLSVAVIYWIVAHEEAGAVLLGLMGTAAGFMGFYLLGRGRHLGRPEDDPDARHEDEAGETVGYFSSGSLWPLIMGLGAALALLGFVYGAWLVFLGLMFFGWAVVGLMMESRG